MPEKIVLHCGAPKTGSTSFQHMLYANRDRLLKAGFYCPAVSRKKRVEDDIRILLSTLSNGAVRTRILHARAIIDGLFAEHASHTLIISNEGLLGKPFDRGGRQFYPLAARQAAQLARTLKGHHVEVRLFIRNYAEFLPSWYVQQVRMGSPFTLTEFVAHYDLATVSWVPVMAALHKHFGAENVRIFDHADLKKNNKAVLAEAYPAIMAALGDDARQVPNKNKSIGIGMVSAYRRWNLIAGRLFANAGLRRWVRHIGRRYVLLPFERFSNSEKIRLEPALAAELSARFQSDLATIRAASFIVSSTNPV